ncbi:hypothetical protein LguiB_031658 [Lonicera macranthoides]
MTGREQHSTKPSTSSKPAKATALNNHTSDPPTFFRLSSAPIFVPFICAFLLLKVYICAMSTHRRGCKWCNRDMKRMRSLLEAEKTSLIF